MDVHKADGHLDRFTRLQPPYYDERREYAPPSAALPPLAAARLACLAILIQKFA